MLRVAKLGKEHRRRDLAETVAETEHGTSAHEGCLLLGKFQKQPW